MQGLIQEYKQSIKNLRTAKVVPVESSSMISDANYAIEIMETGSIPGTTWQVGRLPKEKREISVDPAGLSQFITNRASTDSAPEHVLDLLDGLMKNLTERERYAFDLVRGRGYSFSQAGTLMGCTKGSVQRFVIRAEKKIGLVIRSQHMYEGVI